ncbi:MAG: TonB-dependent receptor [Proteobacteria bacterium]|nr:TonB-dependent receptor [Pseudomonadota bacterium]
MIVRRAVARQCAKACASLAATLLSGAALGQGVDDGVVVSATRSERKTFDVPVSVDAVGAEGLREGQPKVNLSESLGRVPGLVIQNRNNYAQDLQLSIRGFGARSTFGIRGVKLYADGIPSTMPDGSGQAANFDLYSAQRVEVMRGPFASLYGNSAGGVVQIFSEDGPRHPTASAEALLGSWGANRLGLKFGGTSDSINYTADWSRFHTDGWRAHSSVNRQQGNAKLRWQAGEDTRVTLVANTLEQPETQDPLGLTRAQLSADRRQADASAATFNTSKSVRQTQSGITVEHRVSAGNTLRASAFIGDRAVRQYLSVPLAAQAAATSSGGIVDLATAYGGGSLVYVHEGSLAGRPFNFSGGYEQEMMQQRRKGFLNNNGIIGALKRDEDDTVTSRNLFAQADWRFAERWAASAGLRNTRVAFNTRDFFIAGANGDDSGATKYTNTSPVAGMTFRVLPELNLYASAGRGFETPTFAELAYRTGAAGLNFALKPSRSSTAEVGIKGRIAEDHRVSLAYFDTSTRDEIVVDTNVGGRSTFKNASRTRRTGWEASWQAILPANFDALVAWTLLDARYVDAFTSGGLVQAGNKLPGVPASTLYGEVRWRHPGSGFSAALEARRNARVYVDDANSDAAESYVVVNLRAGFEQRGDRWRLAEYVRVDNAANRNYVGSVIVADGNRRFFEPALPRSVSFMLSGKREF